MADCASDLRLHSTLLIGGGACDMMGVGLFDMVVCTRMVNTWSEVKCLWQSGWMSGA